MGDVVGAIGDGQLGEPMFTPRSAPAIQLWCTPAGSVNKVTMTVD